MRPLITALGLAAAVITAGCHLRHSARPDECLPAARYDQARSVSPLHAPEGLPAPNTKNALKMPDELANAKPHKAGTACLDAPPDYFSQKPKTPAAK